MDEFHTMMAIAVTTATFKTPQCRACGSETHFEMQAESRIDYTGKVRVTCGCGHHGIWHDYPLYGTSVPQLWDVLRGAAAAYAMDGDLDG